MRSIHQIQHYEDVTLFNKNRADKREKTQLGL